MPYKIIPIIPYLLYHILIKIYIIFKFFWIFLFLIAIFVLISRNPEIFEWVKWCIIPFCHKNNTPKRNPSSSRFVYGSLVCRFISTTDADICLCAYLPTLFYISISSYKFCLLNSFFIVSIRHEISPTHIFLIDC